MIDPKQDQSATSIDSSIKPPPILEINGPKRIGVEMVTPEKASDFYRIFREVFPPEKYHDEELTEDFFRDTLTQSSDSSIRDFMFLITSTPLSPDSPSTDQNSTDYVGFRWGIFNNGYGYIPYGGVIEAYRRKGVYPAAVSESEKYLLSQGVKMIINDCDRPHPNTDSEDEDRGRLRFFQNIGYDFVDIEFHRAGWSGDREEDKKFDDTDSYLGFKALGSDGPEIVTTGEDRYIQKEALREIYIAFMKLDTHTTEAEALEDYQSYKSFMNVLDQHPGDLVPLLRRVKTQQVEPIPPTE